MSGTKVYVGGLAWATDEHSLSCAFEKFGTISYASVMRDRETGRSRGFGFVIFGTEEQAISAIAGMNGHEIDGCSVCVCFANEPNPPSSCGGFGAAARSAGCPSGHDVQRGGYCGYRPGGFY